MDGHEPAFFHRDQDRDLIAPGVLVLSEMAGNGPRLLLDLFRKIRTGHVLACLGQPALLGSYVGHEDTLERTGRNGNVLTTTRACHAQPHDHEQDIHDMKTVTILSRIPYAQIALILISIALFIGAALGMMVLTTPMFEKAADRAISAAGASYYMQVVQKCPSLEPQARAMMADHDADRAEIRRMNAYVATAKSIVGERRCAVKPVDVDRKDPGSLIL